MLGNFVAFRHSYGDFGWIIHPRIPLSTIFSNDFLQRVVCWVPDELYFVARIALDKHGSTLHC